MDKSTIRSWLIAIRLRTLPLALASIGMGSFLAAYVEKFRWPILILSALTTIFLQILSNLANDYGDAVHGADHTQRKGPLRVVQSGMITPSQMRKAISFMSVLSFVTGLGLLYLAFGWNFKVLLIFLALGIMAIMAAIFYTAGKKPYGYAGFGDISVLLFFGLVGVMGTYYLHTKSLNMIYALPALSCGFFSMAVLNLNNIRDIESDKKAGKKSIPVRIGRKNAVVYHWILLLSGFTSAIIFSILKTGHWSQYLFIITFPLILKNAMAVTKIKDSKALDPYLKQMALTTLLFVITFGIGLLLAS